MTMTQTAEPTTARATHLIADPDVRAWLADHGIDYSQVTEATIAIGARSGYPIWPVRAWLDVTWYKLDEQGRRYVDPNLPDQAATGSSSVPLRSWPQLTECNDASD